MKREFADEHELRAIVAILGDREASVHAVLPEFFRYVWPCGCEIVVTSTRRDWSACAAHAQPAADFRSA